MYGQPPDFGDRAGQSIRLVVGDPCSAVELQKHVRSSRFALAHQGQAAALTTMVLRSQAKVTMTHAIDVSGVFWADPKHRDPESRCTRVNPQTRKYSLGRTGQCLGQLMPTHLHPYSPVMCPQRPREQRAALVCSAHGP
ncbi:unnamed protein product [Urochloa humidicola]